MEHLSQRREPYSLLFCLGFVSAILGALLWTFFQLEWISFYPKQAHSALMIFGFMTAFISGFLMTAVPRMTGSENASPLEVKAAALWILIQWGLAFFNLFTAATVVFILQIMTLIFFL